jgi:membrane protease YdiL (CAAX protease family)
MTMPEDNIPPSDWRPSQRFARDNFLFVVLLLPLILLVFKYYVVGALFIGVAYLLHYYSTLSKYQRAHVPAMRLRLYRDWPISYVVVFAASFLSKDGAIMVLIIVLIYNGIADIRLTNKITESYYPNRAKSDEKSGQDSDRGV